MKSAKSFFNGALFRSNLRRFWPLWALYALMWVNVLPLPLLTRFLRLSSRDLPLQPQEALANQYNMLSTAVTGGHLFAIVFGIFFAMAMFAYLTNPRATGGLHALPARRETLYVTNYLTGLFCMFTAQVLAIALTGLVFVGVGVPIAARTLGLALCSSTLSTVFFYSFGVFCMMFTGQILAAPVFYGILSLLAIGVEQLALSFVGNMLYGYSPSFSAWLDFLSPPYKILSCVHADYIYPDIDADKMLPSGLTVSDLGTLALYALTGLALAALGLAVYRRRHSEATGSTVAIRWAKPIFQYGVALCSALSLGQLLYYILFGQYYSNGAHSLPGILGCTVFMGLLGYFIAEMLLKKSLHVWKSGRLGAAVVAVALAALALVLSFDLTGVERYVPEASQIESVEVAVSSPYRWNRAAFPSDDAQALELVRTAHRSLVDDKVRQQAYSRSDRPYDGDIVNVSLTYYLKGGREVMRQYRLYVEDAETHGAEALSDALDRLLAEPGFAYSRVFGVTQSEWLDLQPRVIGAQLLMQEGVWREDELQFTAEQARALCDAAVRDIEAGRVTCKFNEQRKDPLYELEIYARSPEQPEQPGQPEAAFTVRNGTGLCVYEGMSETLAVLDAMDLN